MRSELTIAVLMHLQLLLLIMMLPNQHGNERFSKSMSNIVNEGASGGVLLTEAFAQPNGDFLLGIDGASVGAASEHMCVLEQRPIADAVGGRAVCWGYSGSGQLDSPKDVDFVQLVAGISFTCGITLEQTVLCWGDISPRSVPGLYAQITASGNSRFACGVLIDGALNCWGWSKLTSVVPKETGDGSLDFVQISCSLHHCCALDSNAYPHCWGSGAVGETKPPLTSYRDYVKARLLDKHAREVLTSDVEEDVYVDESESEEEEEEEDFEKDQFELLAAAELDENDASVSKIQFRQISVGEGYSCGITLLGSHLLCWGKQHPRRVSPPPLQAAGPYRQVSVGGKGVCAIVGDVEKATEKHIKVHGERNTGSITGNTITDQRIREREERRLKSLDGHSSRLEDTLECWLGAKDIVKAPPNSTWDQVTVGSKNICAVSMNSQLHCWGGKVPKELLEDLIVA